MGHWLVNYCGIDSAGVCSYVYVTDDRRRELRAGVQIARLVAIDTKRATRPLRTWFNKVARRRGKKTATVALAKRLLVIAYHLLHEETTYNAARVKRRAA